MEYGIMEDIVILYVVDILMMQYKLQMYIQIIIQNQLEMHIL